jgi:hypothetical protein
MVLLFGTIYQFSILLLYFQKEFILISLWFDILSSSSILRLQIECTWMGQLFAIKNRIIYYIFKFELYFDLRDNLMIKVSNVSRAMI